MIAPEQGERLLTIAALTERVELGDLQAQVLQVVSKAAPTTVADAHRLLNEDRDQPLSYNTVLTVMRVLEEEKGVLERDRPGRAHVYRPVTVESLQEPRGPDLRLGSLEAEVMSVMWLRGESTVEAVQAELAGQRDKERAYNTVMAVMKRLEGKSLLERERSGRAFVYRPAVPRQEIRVVADPDDPRDLQILDVLNELGAGTVRQVRAALAEAMGERPLAYNTVMTLLKGMAEEGLASRHRDGPAYVYTPKTDRSGYLELKARHRWEEIVGVYGWELALEGFVSAIRERHPEYWPEFVRLVKERIAALRRDLQPAGEGSTAQDA